MKKLYTIIFHTIVAVLAVVNGSAQNPSLVKDIFSGSSAGTPANVIKIGSTLYFSADDGINGTELWKSDGTSAGTFMIKDINISPAVGSFLPSSPLTNIGGTLFFAADDGVNGRELWKSDGTSVGTVLVMDVYPGPTVSSFPANMVDMGSGIVFFSANGGSVGVELWRSDGSSMGTYLVKDIRPGALTSSSALLTNAGGGFCYFRANDGIYGAELWRSDGTSTGTVMVKNIYQTPPSTASNPASITNVGGMVYFSANDGTNGIELWKSDGNSLGTIMVADINAAGNSSPTSLTNLGGVTYFAASNGTTAGLNGTELWKSDGNSLGTTMVADVNSGTANSSPANITNIGGVLYFKANDGINGIELWKSDGNSTGTVLVGDINPGASNSSPAAFTDVLNGKITFTATTTAAGEELWITDGTSTGTMMVKDLNPDAASSNPANLILLNNDLYFTADNGTSGTELWKYIIPPTIITSSISSTAYCAGDPVSVSYTITTGYLDAGNTFTAQLSDVSGSFLSPVNIGTLSSITAGTINSIIPSGTSTGTGYRIRIVSDNVVATGSDNGADITITALPTASISASGSITLCLGGSLNLTAGSATTYMWSTGETTQAINVSPAGNMGYSVTVTASGCSNSTSIAVGINPLPTAAISGILVVCSGTAANLMADPAGTYLWSTGETAQSIDVLTAGTYSVVVEDSNGCVDDALVAVTVNSYPTLTVSPNAIICSGDSITLEASGAVNYLWSEGSTASIISPVPVSNTTYSVTGTTNGCSRSANIVIGLKASPVITITGGGTSVCAGSLVMLAANGAAKYSWSNGSTGSLLNIIPFAAATYSVTGTGANGCVNSASVTITVNSIPVSVTPDNVTICAGSNMNITASDGAASYLWSDGQTSADIKVTPVVTTSYSVTGTDANGCVSEAVAMITASSLPPITIAGGGVTVCKGASVNLTATGAATYLWSEGSNVPAINVTPITSTTYFVTGTDANGCTKTISTVVYHDPCTGIEEASWINSVNIYPNPATNNIALSFYLKSSTDLTIEITDIRGQILFFEKRTKAIGEFKSTIDLKGYSKGIYFINLITNHEAITKQIVIE